MKSRTCRGASAALTIAMLIMATTSANAASFYASGTAPEVDPSDIASYGTPTGSDKWWPDPATTYGNPGKTVGQTFTTGGEEVYLNAITFQVTSGTQPEKEYAIRVGTVLDSTFTEIASETATQTVVTADNDYFTWTLDTPVLLSANTLYGVDVGLLSSTSSWETGMPYVYFTADIYPDGTRFRSGTAGYGVGDDTMTHMSGDRVFHLDLGSPTTLVTWDNNEGVGDLRWETAINWDPEGEPDALSICRIDNGDVVDLSETGELAFSIKLGETTATTLNVSGGLAVSTTTDIGGHGTLNVSGSMTSGNMNVATGGTLHVSGALTTGALSSSAAVSIGAGGSLSAGSGSVASISLAGDATISVTGSTLDVPSFTGTGGTLIKQGAGTLSTQSIDAGATTDFQISEGTFEKSGCALPVTPPRRSTSMTSPSLPTTRPPFRSPMLRSSFRHAGTGDGGTASMIGP